MIHSTTRTVGRISSSAMGRRPYVQAHRRRHRGPLLLLQAVSDDRNPVLSSMQSPACTREEKDSSLTCLTRRRPTITSTNAHSFLETCHHIRQIGSETGLRLYHSSSSSSSSFSLKTLLSTLTHRVAALNMIQRRMLQAHSYLYCHLRTIMALLQPFISPATTSTRGDRVIPRALTATSRRRLTLPERIPRGAWDSHMHVVDPAAYPLAKDAIYCPKTHRLDHALAFESSVGIDNIVLVQPSIYGNDNTCLLDALRALGPRRGRAVVAFEPGSLPQSTLREWHRLGVRGVRINLSSVGKSLTAEELDDLLHRYAEDCKPLDWVIQVYMPMSMIELLEPIVPTLGVRVCVDHLGHPCVKDMPSHNPCDMKGFKSLARLLKADNTYVKLSAPYRLSSKADHSDLEPIAREVLNLRGKDRVIFATDWPHTRFEGLDIRPWMETVLDWCGKDDVLVDRLFRGNAEDLWDTRHGRR
ncbi:amidohydrolase [Colletotrichum truncatum]|uniref:Amidohydrolase n=1 Tax=Colletotrichum truncatum TaxID=5467 RepID=A0ACC3YXZ9_COLTU|nr:amidohydrolase [Colletotrichum truncatum]KAF6790852.1 amidohydrolase [Colletotrichum truncatum]